MGEMTQEEIARVAKTLRPAMVNAMVTGNAYGTRVIGKVVTRNALRSRGLIDDASMWTALGWAVVLHVVNTEPGWNPDHFKTRDQIHAEALQEDAARKLDGERYSYDPRRPCDSTCIEHRRGGRLRHRVGCPAVTNPPAPIRNGWQQILGHPDGNIRCIETGIEIRAIGHGFRWEILCPEWQRPERKVLRTVRIFTTKIEALGHATKATRPAMRLHIAAAHAEAMREDTRRRTLARLDGLRELLTSGDKVPGFRAGEVPPMRDRIHAGAYGPDVAAFDINIGDGSLTAAADLVTRAVKRAQYDALRAVLAEVDGWEARGSDLHPDVRAAGRVAANSFRHMLNEAARKLGVREPWRSESEQ